MNFFNFKENQTIIITNEHYYSYSDLPKFEFYSQTKELILILCDNSIGVIAAYIAALNSGHTVMLLAADINHKFLNEIIEKYKPNWIIGLQDYEGYIYEVNKLTRAEKSNIVIHSELALLLSTSGTTGSQKFVRLSYDNLRSNAESIIEYLEISENERAILNLSLSYSYGMSIVNSNLLAGASIILTEKSVMDKSFWEFIHKEKATSIAGVPFTYQMLQRIGFTKMDLPYLKTLTQAGGRLNEKLVKYFAEYAGEHHKKFYVMYGQTEAAPRISYIPYNRVLEKIGSIGIPVPNGELFIDEETDELIYRGPNVMMGYAESLKDLMKQNEMNYVLRTGDTATVDLEGYFTITGRLKRFIKLFGLRINLDEVERRLESEISAGLACTGTDEKLIIVIDNDQLIDRVIEIVEEYYKLHKTAYKIVVMEQIPRLFNGKMDYSTLKELCL